MNIISANGGTERAEQNDPDIQVENGIVDVAVGQWYWLKCTDKVAGKPVETEHFTCCTHVGSNFLRLEEPSEPRYGRRTWRIHFDHFWTQLRRELNPERVLAEKVAQAHGDSKALMTEIQALTQRLGLQSQTGRIGISAGKADPCNNALVILSGTNNLDAYKSALVKAKEETLPELFKRLENANAQVARWMSADVIGLEAALAPMRASLKEIDGKIFNITIYAGLTESAAMAREGAPADVDEPLRIMQSRLYMDEECLAKYEAGGMEFADIHAFDAWLTRDENFYRLFPWPRCAVAFRVRRYEKERQAETLSQAFINFSKMQADKKTFLYIRNGEQLWWIESDLDFGPNLFPDQAVFDPSRPLMAHRDRFDKEDIITLDDFEVRSEQAAEAKRLHEQWVIDNPIDDYKAQNRGNSWGYTSPYQGDYGGNSWRIQGDRHFDPTEWKPMDPSNVYFDDYLERQKAVFDSYNRIALVVQGLFDRSMCLHPHHPVQLWNPGSFARSVELIYDGQATLYSGEKPDIGAYLKKLNAQIGPNSVVIGQERKWLEREAARENDRRARNYNCRGMNRDLVCYSPLGDPGPGYTTPITEWKPRTRKALFRWERETNTFDRFTRDYTKARCSIEVEADSLFNVSAYKSGDFKQFFNDRRTRHEYLRWAPLLLAAEDYQAGKKD